MAHEEGSDGFIEEGTAHRIAEKGGWSGFSHGVRQEARRGTNGHASILSLPRKLAEVLSLSTKHLNSS